MQSIAQRDKLLKKKSQEMIFSWFCTVSAGSYKPSLGKDSLRLRKLTLYLCYLGLWKEESRGTQKGQHLSSSSQS